MRYIKAQFILIIIILSGTGMFGAEKLVLKGRVFEWLEAPPYGSTIILTDTSMLRYYKLRPLDSVRIRVLWGSEFRMIDTIIPKTLEPVIYSDKEGKFVFTGEAPADSLKLAISADKPDFLGNMLPFNFKKGNKSPDFIILMVKYIKFNKK